MRPAYFAWQNFFSKKTFEKYNIDVVHIPNPIPVLKTPEFPTVITIHDTAELQKMRHSGFHQKFRIWATKLSGKFSKKILTVSEFSKMEIINLMGIDEKKIQVTYPGLTLDTAEGLRNKIIKKEPYILYVGGYQSHKNVNRLIEAYLLLKVKNKPKLVLVGDFRPLLLTTKEVNDLQNKNVYFTGYLSERELFSLYKDTLALVYPSLYEGFGLPILEAMSLGVPVITSNKASMPEVAGDAALLINPESIYEIIKAMREIIINSNLRKELIRKGYKQALKFSWEETTHKTISVYEKASLC